MTISKNFLPLFRGIDTGLRRLPQLVADSGKLGPTVWLTAAIHGNEVTGTAVIQSIFKRLESSPLITGKLYAIPILNPTGFEANTRKNIYAEADLNRFFDGDETGSTSERLASLILTAVLSTKPDFVIDLHTDSMNSIAYTIIDDLESPEFSETMAKSLRLAQTLKLAYSLDNQASAGYPVYRSFTGQLIKRGIPALTVELGGPSVVMDEFRQIGLESIWNLLYSKKMVNSPSTHCPQTSQIAPYHFHPRIDTNSTGIIDYRVKPGEKVKKGQVLAKIKNVFGETIEIIRSPINCMVFSHEDQSITFPGQDLFTLAKK